MAVNWDALLNIKANVHGKRDIQRLGRSLQGVESNYKALGRTIKNLAVTYLGFRTVQSSVQAAIRRTESNRRLSLLAEGYGEIAQAQEAAAKSAKTFGLSQTQANRQFAQIYARLRPIGIELDQIVTVFDGFNTAAKLGGATATEASAAFLQLSQGLGTGILRGEELNAVFEQTPLVVVAIAKQMGVAVGEIRNLAKEGKVTADIVIAALGSIATEGAGDLAKALGGPEQALIDFRNEIENLQVLLVEDFLPAVIPLLQQITELLGRIGPALKALTALPQVALGTLNQGLRQFQIPDDEERARANIRAGEIPFGVGASGASTSPVIKKIFENFANEFGFGFEALLEEARLLKDYEKNVLGNYRSELSVVLELMNKHLPQVEAIDKSIAKAAEAMKSDLVPAAKEGSKAIGEIEKGVRDGMKAYYESIQDTAKNIKEATVNAFKGMEDAMVKMVMTGKFAFKDLARSILADMARIAIRAMIIKPIMAGFGIGMNAKGNVFDQGVHVKEYAKGGVIYDKPTMFAMGGSGQLGILGEAGPEAVLPLRRGKGGRLGVEGGGGTNIVVNVDASGSSVEGDEQGSKMLGQMIGAAIRSTLIQEQRPGGLLAA